LFALAKANPGPVVVTTTTHLGVWQIPLADDHLILAPGEDLLEKNPNNYEKIMITGPAGSDDRLAALTPRQLEALRDYCQAQGIPLLIEADGARQRNVKAPAEHEPAIPAWVDQVMVVAGLGALGAPLDEENVHRLERFAALSGLALGQKITVEALVRVLGSMNGGLKNIPERAKRALFLNQADTPLLQSQAGRIASALENVYPQVMIGSMQHPGQDGPGYSVRSQVAGIVLAAGGSQRLGRPKQLLDWQGQPFIAKVVQNALAAGLAPLIVVTGADSDQVCAALAGLPVQIVPNPDWQEGQSTSLRAGVAALPEDCQGVMLLVSDLPQVSPILIRSVMETFFTQKLPIAAPRITGRRANPVIFGRETFEALDAVRGDQGGRAIFNQFPAAWVDWVDERSRLDVDDEDSYALLNRAYIPNPERGTGFHDFLSDSGD
jgi:molybdenum cofactor cytidylyltransferase